MCVIEQRTYVQPNGRKETFEHVKSRCHLAGTGKTCRQTTYEERTMQGAGHSRHSPRVRYADESSLPSPATESFPPTPVDGATVVEVTPTSAGFRPHSSPKHHRKSGSYGKIVFDFGGSKKEKTKTRPKKYHGSSAASEATSSSSIRSYSPAPPSPLSATHEANLSPTYQYSHRRSNSATVPSPSIPFATSTRTPTRPDSRVREEHHFLSPQTGADTHLARPLTQADPPMGPPGPPRRPAPPAAADPPSPGEPSRRRHRKNAPPPIVTQQHSRSSEYRTAPAASSYSTSSRSHNSRSEASSQVASDREFAEKLSASLNNLHMGDEPTQPTETEDERQARIERERFEQREKLRKERQADEYWAEYYREREERREEGRRKNEEQRRSADDWETRLEDGRRRLEQELASRPPLEDRHDPTVDVGPAESSGDDDWEAQLAEGRRRLADLKRTEAANINNNTTWPSKRERRPSHSSNTLPRRRNSTTTGRPNVRFASTNSSSSPNVTSSNSGVDPEEAERARLYAFETQQMARERNEFDAMLAARIAEAEAEIRNAEARLANRRERERRERLVEGMYGAYTYDSLNTGASHGDYYSPRIGMGGAGGGLRHETRRLDGQRSSRLPIAVTQQGGATGGMRESGWERGQRFIGDVRSGRHRRGSSSHRRWEGEESRYY